MDRGSTRRRGKVHRCRTPPISTKLCFLRGIWSQVNPAAIPLLAVEPLPPPPPPGADAARHLYPSQTPHTLLRSAMFAGQPGRHPAAPGSRAAAAPLPLDRTERATFTPPTKPHDCCVLF
jgi:hypothetical protein